MRNPTQFHFDVRAARVRQLRQLFQQRLPRGEQKQKGEQETALSPTSDTRQDAAPELVN